MNQSSQVSDINQTISEFTSQIFSTLVQQSDINQKQFNLGEFENMTFEKLCAYFKINQNEMEQKLDKILQGLDSTFNVFNKSCKDENRLQYLLVLMIRLIKFSTVVTLVLMVKTC